MAGGQHHHRTNLDKYHPGYFGKVGMRRFHLLRNQQWKPEINVDKVRPVLSSFPPPSLSPAGSTSTTRVELAQRPILTRSARSLQLWSLLPIELREKHLKGSADTAPVIDLTALGYAKLLGKGQLPKAPLVIRARYVSKLAESKITKAGGVIELVA